MLQSLAPSQNQADIREELVIVPHHPDRLGRPPARLADISRKRYEQTLTWNVFRTLELLLPAFWLRRLHVRLTGNPPPAAPQIARVRLWPLLPLPPIQRIDGALADVLVDVVIETEHAVWALSVGETPGSSEDGGDRFAQIVDAASWLAGARACYAGIIDSERNIGVFGSVLADRYGRSRESASLRSATRGPGATSLRSCGVLHWEHLAAVLADCADSTNLTAIERALARNTVQWLRGVGVT